MKQYLFILMLLVGCSKSNQTTPAPTPGSYIRVNSADTAAGVMNVHIKIVGASQYTSLKLIIYQTDIGGLNYKYPIQIQDGDQIVSCNKFSDSSPMNYQIQIDGTFSNMMSLAY